MAAASDIGAGFSNYQGNAAIGGGVIDAFKIDNKPLEDLSRYTFIYHQAQDTDKKAKAAAASKELADQSAYDLSSAIPKDRQVINDAYDEFTKWTRDNAYRLDGSDENRASWIDFQSRKNKFSSLLTAAKVRDVMYKARQASYADKSPEIAGELQKQLDEEAQRGDINTPLQIEKNYDLTPIEVKAAPVVSVDVTRKGDNQIVQRGYAIPSYKNIWGMATAIVGGLVDAGPKEGTPEYDNLSEDAKRGLAQKRKLQTLSGKLQPVADAEVLNAVINKTDETGKKVYFKDQLQADGTTKSVLDVNALMQGESGNGLFVRTMQQVSSFNNQVTAIKDGIANGDFQDSMGKKLSFGFGMQEDDLKRIDLDKGSITPEELVALQIAGKTQEVSYKTSVIQTNEKHQNQVLDETTRHNKAEEGIGREANAIHKAQVDGQLAKWKEGAGGSETTKNAAMVKAKSIYDSLMKLADSNGTISPDKMRQLNSEQLNFLGSNQTITLSSGEQKSTFLPLQFAEGKEYAMQLVNGEIKIMESQGEKIEPSANGGYKGLWSPTKSTNIRNVATNILNEEVVKSGNKEVSLYSPIDAGTGDVYNQTDGGGTYSSGTTASKTKASGGNSSTVPTYSRAKLTGMGYSDSYIDELAKKGGFVLTP